MRFDRLDLNLLFALDTLIERCNVSLAAKDLCLSQSAMSGALNRLRDYFEDDLLVQSGRKMLLTPKAMELAEPVREALLFVRSNITAPRRFDPAISDRSFTLVASDYAHQLLLADVIRSVFTEAPKVMFDVRSPDQFTVDQFNRGAIDLLITIESNLLGIADYHPRLPLFEDEEVLICWTENDACREELTLDAFMRLGHATVSFGENRIRAVADMIYEERGLARNIEVTLPTFSYLPQAIVGTQRIATMHRRHAQYFARFLPIKLLPIPFAMPKVQEVVIWHTTRGSDPGTKWLCDKLKQAAENIQ